MSMFPGDSLSTEDQAEVSCCKDDPGNTFMLLGTGGEASPWPKATGQLTEATETSGGGLERLQGERHFPGI